jgi:two-component system sensor histidine kinase UhpB
MKSSTLQGRVLIASLIAACVAMIAVIWWYYARQRDAIETAMLRELAAIAAVKVDQIANWRSERVANGRVLASSETMRLAGRVLSGREATAADRADLLDVMRRLEREYTYTGVALVDREGNIRLQSTSGHPVPSRLRQFAQAAIQAGEVRLQDLYLDAVLGRPLMAVTIPVHDLGAVILEIDPSRFLYPYISDWPGPSKTAESLLVRPVGANEILYLNELRHQRGTALVFRRSFAMDLPPSRYFENGFAGKRLDYRGVPVMGIARHVPNSPWYLVTKIDAAEVEAPVRRRAWEIALITALIGVAITAGVGFIWRAQQAHIFREREAWFYAVANDTPAYLWMASANQQNSFINTPFRKFLGAEQQLLTKDRFEYVHPEDVDCARARFLECLAGRSEYNNEYRVRRFDGEYRWVTTKGMPRFSPTGEFLGYAGSVIDITDRREAEERLRTANGALAAELAERTLNEREIRSLSARLINAQEEERARIARELHDDLSQQIAALSIAMGNLKRQVPTQETDVRNQSDRIQQKLVQFAESLRLLSHQLHPAVLEHSGLASALRAYCDEFATLTGIRVSFHAEGSFDHVAAPAALGLYRIVQEALQNVAKHANTTDAEVALQYSEGKLCLTIADRGAGMEVFPARSGLGLLSIKERTRLLGGTVEILSRPNQGTTITIVV